MIRRCSSLTSTLHSSSGTHSRDAMATSIRTPVWGTRRVLILINVRLGVDCFNPMGILSRFVFSPSFHFGSFNWDLRDRTHFRSQWVSVVGHRHYFVGIQVDSLLYLDPHHAQSSVPLPPIQSYTGNSLAREISPKGL
jgi:Peptidase family C54